MKTTVRFGCEQCHFYTENKVCIKTSFTKREINQGRRVTLLNLKEITLNLIRYCPMKISKTDMIRLKKAKEKGAKLFG